MATLTGILAQVAGANQHLLGLLHCFESLNSTTSLSMLLVPFGVLNRFSISRCVAQIILDVRASVVESEFMVFY